MNKVSEFALQLKGFKPHSISLGYTNESVAVQLAQGKPLSMIVEVVLSKHDFVRFSAREIDIPPTFVMAQSTLDVYVREYERIVVSDLGSSQTEYPTETAQESPSAEVLLRIVALEKKALKANREKVSNVDDMLLELATLEKDVAHDKDLIRRLTYLKVFLIEMTGNDASSELQSLASQF